MPKLGMEGCGDPHTPPPGQIFSWVLVGPVPFFSSSEASLHALVSFWNKKGRMKAAGSQLSIVLKWPQDGAPKGTRGGQVQGPGELVAEGMGGGGGNGSSDLLHPQTPHP